MKKLLSFLIIYFLLLTSSIFPQEGLQKARIDDFSGGQNSYDLADIISPNQGVSMKNIVLSKKGHLTTRKGQALFANDVSDTAFTGLGVFYPDVTTDYIIAASGVSIVRSTTAGADWTILNASNPLTTGKDTEFIQANNFLVILNGQDSPPFYDGTTWYAGGATASPPVTTTGAWLLNYLFVAGNPTNYDRVYFSNNLNPRWFTSTDIVNINAGDGQKIQRLEAFRLFELIVYKERSIYVLDIEGTTPLVDWTVQPITRTIGCVAPRSVVNMGNDQWFLSSDPIAVRSLVRSSFDKILIDMVSKPIQDIFDGTGSTTINTTVIDKACAVLFDDKYILAIAVGTSSVNNYVVVYDFITKSWYVIDGWYPAAWVVFNSNLYYIDSNDGRAVQCFTGTTGDLTVGPIVTIAASEPTVAISYEYICKNLDFDNPENYKMPDALELEFMTTGDYTATINMELDDGGYQNIGTVNLAGDAPTLPINLPFTLGGSGVARETFHLQGYGEFRKMNVKVTQSTLGQTCDLSRFTAFARVKPWRRE